MKRLYVSNVSSKSDENELRELFEECGKMKFFGIKEGAGYIVRENINYKQEYETPEEANECLKKYERYLTLYIYYNLMTNLIYKNAIIEIISYILIISEF